MIIYIKEKDSINKYSVLYEVDALSELRKEIINNCSTIVHHEENSVWGPSDRDILKYRNIKRSEKSVGVQEYDCAADDILYHYSYDEYVYPTIVNIIDKLLEGNPIAIDMLYNYEIPQEKDYDDFIKVALKSFEETSNLEDKKSILNRINNCLEEKKLNKDRKSVNAYYFKLKDLIKFILIDSIKLSEVESVMNFFENNVTNNCEIIDESQRKLIQ